MDGGLRRPATMGHGSARGALRPQPRGHGRPGPAPRARPRRQGCLPRRFLHAPAPRRRDPACAGRRQCGALALGPPAPPPAAPLSPRRDYRRALNRALDHLSAICPPLLPSLRFPHSPPPAANRTPPYSTDPHAAAHALPRVAVTSARVRGRARSCRDLWFHRAGPPSFGTRRAGPGESACFRCLPRTCCWWYSLRRPRFCLFGAWPKQSPGAWAPRGAGDFRTRLQPWRGTPRGAGLLRGGQRPGPRAAW